LDEEHTQIAISALRDAAKAARKSKAASRPKGQESNWL